MGSAGFSAGYANYVNLAFEPGTLQPYVAYSDTSSLSNKAVVQRFDGASVRPS